jgi:multiple sugar transport system substrate-binding protein
MTRTRHWGALCAAAALALGGLSACGSSSGSGSGGGTTNTPSASGPTRGQTINVAIAYPAPKALLKQFTAQTGIKVNWDYLQWDDLQTKIASAAQAHSYFADVADVDWSKVGEYYQTKWFLPLNSYFNPSSRVNIPSSARSFVTTP